MTNPGPRIDLSIIKWIQGNEFLREVINPDYGNPAELIQMDINTDGYVSMNEYIESQKLLFPGLSETILKVR